MKGKKDATNTSKISDDERALRLMLEIAMAVYGEPTDVDFTLSSFDSALKRQKKLDEIKSLEKPADENASQTRSRRGSFALSRRGSIVGSRRGSWRESRRGKISEYSFDDESVYGSETETSEADDDRSEVDTMSKTIDPKELDAAIKGLITMPTIDDDSDMASSSVVESDIEESEEQVLQAPPSVSAAPVGQPTPEIRSGSSSMSLFGRFKNTKHFGEGDISRTASPGIHRKKKNSPSTSKLARTTETSNAENQANLDPRVAKLIADIKQANTTITELNRDQLTIVIMIMALVNPKKDDAHEYKIRSYQSTNGMVREIVRDGECNSELFFNPSNANKFATHSILFCQDAMTQLVRADMINVLLKIIGQIKADWLARIKQENLKTSMTQENIEYILVSLYSIETLLNTKKNVTPLDFLDDSIRPFYQTVLDYKYPYDRYLHLPRLKKETKSTLKRAPKRTGENLSHLQRRQIAIKSDWQKLDKVVSNIEIGRCDSFKELTTDKCKEEALRRLDFSQAKRMTTTAVVDILTQNIFKPRTLNLAGWNVPSVRLHRILNICGAELAHLDLSDCLNVTDDLFDVLAKHCPNIQTLVIAGTNISSINGTLPKLTSLDVSRCKFRYFDKKSQEQSNTDIIFKEIAKHCPKLRVLKMNKTPIKEVKITRMNLTRLEASECLELRSIYTYSNAADKKTGTATPTTGNNSVASSPTTSRKKNKATKARRLAFIVADNNPRLKRVLIEDESFPIGISAQNNPELHEVFVKNGDKMNRLNFEGCHFLEILRIAPNVLSYFNIKGCHSIRKALPERLEWYLLDAIIGSKLDTNGDPELAGSAYTILLRTKDNFYEWAVETSKKPFFDKWILQEELLEYKPGESRGENIFNRIALHGFNFSFCTLRGSHFDAELKNGIAHQTNFAPADFEDAAIINIDFGQKMPIDEHNREVLTAVAYSQESDFIGSAHKAGRAAVDSFVLTKPDGDTLRLKHEGSVSTIAFTPDGKYVATAGYLWDVNLSNHQHHYEDRAHPEKICDITKGVQAKQCFNVPTFNMSCINIWSLEDVAPKRVIDQTASKPDGMMDEQWEQWKVQVPEFVKDLPPRLVHSYYTHPDEITQIAFSPCGKLLASTDGESLRIRNWLTGKTIVEYTLGKKESITCFAFHPDPNKHRLATGGAKNIVIWDTSTGKKIKTIAAHDSMVKLLDFNDGGNYLLSSSDDKTIKVWEFHTWKQVKVKTGGKGDEKTFTGHKHQVLAAKFLPGSLFIASADDVGPDKNQLLIWDARTHEIIHQCDLPNAMSKIATKQLTGGDNRSWEVLTACYDGLLYRWVVTDKKVASPVDTKKTHALCFHQKADSKTGTTEQKCNIEGIKGVSDENLAFMHFLGADGQPGELSEEEEEEHYDENLSGEDGADPEDLKDGHVTVVAIPPMSEATKFTVHEERRAKDKSTTNVPYASTVDASHNPSTGGKQNSRK